MCDKGLKERIEGLLGEKISGGAAGGGRIVTGSGKEYFLKCGRPSETYRCEAAGLGELARSGAIRTAKAVAAGDDFILTEYIAGGPSGRDFFEDFGRRLARMHRCRGDGFGFREDNFIGANPQINLAAESEKNDWAEFYFNKRLSYQYRLAERNGYVSAAFRSDFRTIGLRIHSLLEGSEEPPALLHGDLWSGNYICDGDGSPVLIDPAIYYGHREADLAMTKLFGGFPEAFYRAYQDEYPLKEGWRRRENLYKLYHVMNHLNIFGRSYLREAEFIVRQYAGG